jgi:NAD(P)-dependent dehydrogenase (short-subunit alcohol dehydrogenase family)
VHEVHPGGVEAGVLDVSALEGRPFLVTGGSSGLGRAVVTRLLGLRARPLVLDVQPPPLEVEHLTVDLADGRAAEEAVHTLAERAGGLAGVVSAAGMDACGRLEDVPAALWERVVQVNLLGTVAVVRAALPFVRRADGHIVTVASTLGLRALSDATAYCASKFGVVGFTRALACEVGPDVGVTLLVPGGMRTPFFDGRAERYRPAPDANLCPPTRVAEAVVFALAQPPGCGVRELIYTPDDESSWP